jgi:hypothetical protein
MGFSELNKGYRPRTNIVQDEKTDFVTDSYSVLARWRKHFSQLLNVNSVSDIKQTEIQKDIATSAQAECLCG